MILILEVTLPQPTIGGASRWTFRKEGGSIGRKKDNSWVLPHAKVSGHHAVVTYRDQVYYIEDRSTNGVFLNSPANRLERGRPYALKSGDRILIDPYEIRVSIAPDQDNAAERDASGHVHVPSSSDLFDASHPLGTSNPFDADDPFAPRPVVSSGLESPAEQIEGQPLDPLELLELVPKRSAPPKAPNVKDLDLGSPLDQHYQPPAVMPAPASESPAQASAIPQGYDPLAPDAAPSLAPPSSSGRLLDEGPAHHPPETPVLPHRMAPAPPPPIAPTPLPPTAAAPPPLSAEKAPVPVRASVALSVASPSPSGADFAAVLAGAGLDPSQITAEVARDFGQILRVVVSGVMDVMRSRQQIKDEFRMRMTRVKRSENNPLKFSADVDDALHNLLVKRNPAYLPPVAAFEDAFADLRLHQIAMLAGMRAAFESMLAEFDPDRLQQNFDRQLNKGLVPAKLRYWELYRGRCQEIVKDPEASFRRLFGARFAEAYEEQLRQLKARENSGKASPPNAPEHPDA